jgi:pyruvate/2-oxoglutarate dehydrogenase complex dihydrolipoamide dehydrogenase (E3) component
MPQEYAAIVIGAGQSGGPLATALAGAGHSTALIERSHVGGTCVNVGCTPTKTMVASARVAYVARRSAEYGIHTGPVHVDMAEVRRRKQALVEEFRSGSESSIAESDQTTLIRGEARFTGYDEGSQRFQLAVQPGQGPPQTLSARQVFIDTGSRPRIPDLPGLASVPYLNSTSIMELDSVPGHLLVIGGGYVGLEFAQMFHRFGSRVTIVQRGKQLLGREDSDIADALAEILREDGIELLLEAKAQRVAQQAAQKDENAIHLTVQLPDGERTLRGSHLLVATGRVPNSDSLQLDKVGVATDDKGYIRVNERLETNVPGIYAMGDVTGGPAFTHISYDDFRVLRANLLNDGNASTKERFVPYVVFTDPQLGRVGLSETEARAQGYTVRVAKLPMARVARAIEVGETRGMMKVVVDGDTEQILGCAILGYQGGEIAAMLQIAMLGKVPYPAIQNGVFAHPTLAESLNNLFTALE